MGWLTPVTPALWEAEEGDHLRSGVPDQLSQHGETSSLLTTKTTYTNKQTKKPNQMWWWVPVTPPTQQAEARELLELRRWSLQ